MAGGGGSLSSVFRSCLGIIEACYRKSGFLFERSGWVRVVMLDHFSYGFSLVFQSIDLPSSVISIVCDPHLAGA